MIKSFLITITNLMLIGLCCISQVQSRQAAQDLPVTPVITTTAPSGFEDLLEPQLTLVDIYYNRVLIGASMATYTNQTIQFESPQEVVNLIPDIIDRQALQQQLTQIQASNQELVCFFSGQTNCGVLSPQTVAVIFDESQLRVDIFINPQLLQTQTISIDKYLPPSTAGASMINAVSLVAAGGEQREDVYSAYLNSLLSYDNYRLMSVIEADDQHDLRLDQLSFTYELRELAYQVGSFRTLTQSSGFFDQRDFIGVRVQSSLASRTDLEQVSGTQLFVFLSERSRIDVYKDQRLIDSQIYPAGNVEIDTRDFPQGAYNVELKIFGDSGRETTESHFYSKSLQLPPKGEALFFVEAGFPEAEKNESYPVAQNEPLLRLGMLSRPTDYFGYSGALIKNSQQEMLEVGSYWLGNQIEFQTNHAFTSEQEHANYYQLGLRHPNFFMSVSYRRTYSDDLPILEPGLQLIGENSRQSLFNIGFPLGEATLNLFARTRERNGLDSTRSIGLSWRKNIFRSGRMLLDWTVDASKDNIEQRFITGLTLRFISNRMSLDSSLRHNHQKTINSQTNQNSHTTHLDKNVRVAYRNPDSTLGVINTSLDITETEQQISSSVQSEVSNDYGYGRIILDNIQPENNQLNSAQQALKSRTGYSLTSHFNLVSDGGKLTLGGSRQNTAGVMLDLTSVQVEGLYFAVIINDVEMTRIKAGDSSFIALPPYQTYQLSISPIGEALVQFDNTRKAFTLYPGNVESLRWDIQQVRVVVMQLIDQQNIPLKNAKLTNRESYSRSDDLGWVQLELSELGALLFVDPQGQECRIEISQQEASESVNYLGERHCL